MYKLWKIIFRLPFGGRLVAANDRHNDALDVDQVMVVDNRFAAELLKLTIGCRNDEKRRLVDAQDIPPGAVRPRMSIGPNDVTGFRFLILIDNDDVARQDTFQVQEASLRNEGEGVWFGLDDRLDVRAIHRFLRDTLELR